MRFLFLLPSRRDFRADSCACLTWSRNVFNSHNSRFEIGCDVDENCQARRGGGCKALPIRTHLKPLQIKGQELP
jgi:hypothetical protein